MYWDRWLHGLRRRTVVMPSTLSVLVDQDVGCASDCDSVVCSICLSCIFARALVVHAGWLLVERVRPM